MKEEAQKEPEFGVYIGLDWADRTHVISLRRNGSNKKERYVVAHTPEGLAAGRRANAHPHRAGRISAGPGGQPDALYQPAHQSAQTLLSASFGVGWGADDGASL